MTTVLLAINSLGNTPFSIYDVTKTIRKKVNSGEYEFEDGGTTVPHDLIKDCFLDLLNSGLLADYTVVDSGKGYRQFVKYGTCTPVVDGLFEDDDSSLGEFGAYISGCNGTDPVFCQDALTRIYDYLVNNPVVTVKKIQSALTKYRYTCEQIKQLLRDMNILDPKSEDLPASLSYTI